MGDQFFSLFSFLTYWLRKEDQYSIHSPRLFKIYTELLRVNLSNASLDLDIEEWRKSLLNSQETIEVLDLGAGSKKVNFNKRKVADITKYSTSSRKVAQLLQFFCRQTPAQQVLELGTCVGISTRYLAGATTGKLTTFEGSPELARVATAGLTEPNVELVLGNIADTVPTFLQTIDFVDFAFVDANHSYLGTMDSLKLILQRIRPGSIIALGDIHWSREMELAWNELIKFPEVKLSLGFYEVGILFFEGTEEKQHYVLDF